MKIFLMLFLLTLSTSFVFGQLTSKEVTRFTADYILKEMDGYLVSSSILEDKRETFEIGIPSKATFDDVRRIVRHLTADAPEITIYFHWRLDDRNEVPFYWTALIYRDSHRILVSYWPSDHTVFVVPEKP